MSGSVFESLKHTLMHAAGLEGNEPDPSGMCGVRVLEEITGVPAPSAAFVRRHRDQQTLFNLAFNEAKRMVIQDRSLSMYDALVSALQRCIRESVDAQQVKGLIRDLRRSPTPMGEVLRERPFRAGWADRRRILEELKYGNSVMYFGVVATNSPDGSVQERGHIAHLAQRGRRLMDTILELPIRMRGKAYVIVFEKEKKP